MDKQDIRTALEILQDRVRMEVADDGSCMVSFEDLDRDGMKAIGIADEVADVLAGAPWWEEMVEDVADTPDFCEPDDTPEQVLRYARDVVQEYVFKRL